MRAVKFFIEADLYLEDRDPESRFPERLSWAIVRHGSVFNREGEWEWEPSPSNRDDAFLFRCRFTFEEACTIVQGLKKTN